VRCQRKQEGERKKMFGKKKKVREQYKTQIAEMERKLKQEGKKTRSRTKNTGF
jgi:hypothetical protein